MLIKSFLIFTMLLLQSCSNTFIGEKLENSFDIIDNPTPSSRTDKGKKKLNEKKSIESSFKDDKKKNKTDYGNIIKENSISNKDRGTQKSTKSIRKIIFNPQPYRIILRLSGANPSAPAETVTRALRKAGVQFEVEKIERFDKDTSIKR